MSSSKLQALSQTQLNQWVAEAERGTGQQAVYVPLLAAADPQRFAVWVQPMKGEQQSVGAVEHQFALMSVVKPFLLLFLLHQLGSETVFSRVGITPSEQPFNSITQLEVDHGIPRNPMLNSGALALADLLSGADGTSGCEQLRQWLNQQSGSNLWLDQGMLASVRSLPNQTNRALAERLSQSGRLHHVERALDTYNQICCLSGSVADLAQLGQLLAQASPQVLPIHAQTVNALMLTCGLYEAAGDYAIRIGLPIKSGVSGALLAVIPGEGTIASYSPRLDGAGNSVLGLALIEQIARTLKLSIFSY